MTESEALSATKQALLAQRLRRGTAAPRRTIPSRPGGEQPPLSHAQERLWFLEQFTPGTTQLTIPIRLRLRGPLDAAALAAALDATVAGHDALRMRFPDTGDGRPRVVLADDATLPLTVRDAPDEAAARALAEEFLAVPFDLAAGPVARALLVRLGEDDHVLVVAVHHIAADGWSADVLLREVFARYDGRAPDTPQVGYGDYAAWQRGLPPSRRDLDFWRDKLAGLEPLDLPTDRPRPPERTYTGAAHTFSLDPGTAAGLARLGREHRATPYMVMLSALTALLGRYAGVEDVAVGSPVAGRQVPELDGVIGCFVNMLTMRVDLTGDPTFAELVDRVRDVVLDAFAHQDLPFEQLVSELDLPRDVSRSPLFGVLFAMQNYRHEAVDPPAGLTVDDFPVDAWATRYDLELYVGDDSGGMFVYNTDLFEAGTVERLAGHLCALLDRVAAEPDLRLSRIDLLSEEERRLVLDGWNDTAADYPGEATLHGPIEAQAARTPDAVAVRFEGRALTYRELDAAADRIAHTLRGHGVGPGSVVAVCAERSLELLPGLLGVLKAGAAYLPVDPDYPPDRVAFMLADAAPPVLLTQRAIRPDLPETGATILDLDDPDVWTGAPGPLPEVRPDDVAYVIYTSGSTGRPKGVPNTHGAIANRLDWMQERYGLDEADVVAQKTPLSFDVSVWELFWPLRSGARLVLATPGGHKDAAYLRRFITNEGVTTAHFVPSMLAVFLAENSTDAGCGSLRRIICSGEELPADLARRCVATLPAAELHNLYGPTEAAVDVSAWHCLPETLASAARVPIGTPIANTSLYVLDAAMSPVPIGVPGELYIGGAGLARGYLNRPALTAERFVPNPYGPPGSRLYRTGDLVRRRADGVLEFLGRLDSQVKLRGLRIELGEIEAALRALPAVGDAAVIVRDDRLVAYVTPDGGTDDLEQALDHGALRAELKKTLPDYMVPAAYVTLASLPLSPNGKLDRRRLPAPVASRDASVEFIAPDTPTERALAAIWSELLEVEGVGVDDDFFDLGGHSLLATQVVARLRQELSEVERLRSDQRWVNWLISQGLALNDLEPEHARRIVRNMRRDSRDAEDYYTRLFESGTRRLRAPVISVVGTEDPATDYYQERFREWHFLTSVSAVVVLAEAGHFFLKYRAQELAQIVTTVHRNLEKPEETERGGDRTWWLHDVSHSDTLPAPSGVRPGIPRFLAVALSQLVTMTGAALTEFAVPLWIYTTTGSVAKFALMAVVGLVPGMLVAPIAGAIIDRANRRRVMMAGNAAAFTIQLAFGILLWTDNLSVEMIYPLLGCLSIALTFQRLAYFSAVPQLVPKHYLGHAVGITQLGNGTAQLLVPIFAVGLLSTIGLGGILLLDIAGYAIALVILLVVRFPASMPWRRRESIKDEILGGLRYSLGHRGFIAMLLFFVVLNVFLAPLLLMFSPLVLAFSGLTEVGRIAFLAGAGTLIGALIMTVWGGPRQLRLRGVLLCTLVVGVCCLLTGVRADLFVIAAGVCGITLWMTVLNGIYTTIVQVKVPQRFHGRVFAMNTLIAWSTLPIGYGLVAPYAAAVLDPLLMEGGALASTVGALIGTGPGRGIGFMYVLFGLVIMAIALIAMRVPALARFDREVPDAVADDLVGVQALRSKEK